MGVLRQLTRLMLRSGPGGRSQQAVQALVPLLEERGESKDWRRRLVEFGPAEGELSTVPGSEESED